jgi:hypothetical protein
MLFKTISASVYGIDAYLVEVEVDVGSARMQDFNVVGLPDNAVKDEIVTRLVRIYSGYILMQSNKRISRIQSKWVTKKVKTTVPPGQQAAMQASYLLGKSIRQIARKQHRDPATVSKIVKSSEMDRIVLDMREKFFGKLLPRALESIQFALDEETDGRLAIRC